MCNSKKSVPAVPRKPDLMHKLRRELLWREQWSITKTIILVNLWHYSQTLYYTFPESEIFTNFELWRIGGFLIIHTVQTPKQYIKFGHNCSFTLLWHWEPLTSFYRKWRVWYAARDQLHTAVNVTNMLWHHSWTKNLGKENQMLEYHHSLNCIWF
jgi:hypothetical protein